MAQQATFLTPRNSAIDVTEANDFTCLVNSTTDKYRIQIFPIAGGSTVYDTGEVSITPIFRGDTLVVEVPANSGTLANGNEYKWSIQVFDGTDSETSDEVAFVANARPVINFTVPASITAPSYTFTPTYSQADGVEIQQSYFIFRNADGSQLLRTPTNFTGNLSYTFDGFLSGLSYSVQFFGVTQNGVPFETSVNNFSVSYAQPNINIKPTVTQNRMTSIVNIAWANAVVIPGASTGTFSYIDNFGYQGNTALDLDASSTVTWGESPNDPLSIPEQFSTVIRVQLQSGFTGDLPEHITGSQTYTVGYDGTRWYFNNKGAQGFSQPIALSTNVLFIVVRPTDVVIYDKTADTFTTLTTN